MSFSKGEKGDFIQKGGCPFYPLFCSWQKGDKKGHPLGMFPSPFSILTKYKKRERVIYLL